jgi:DNA-binding cell septation regulator SpoVG
MQESYSARIAMKDISEYLHSQNINIIDGNDDVWVVTPSRMQNKETRKLNSELGLHKINKHGIKMSRYKQII